ncbi:amino acid permease [Methanococcoides sp. SA1]|nr:amino acid permease [Methanococcoides sp. SA1]
MVNKKFWATTFTLSGTIIGAGILGLPYIFAQSGFLIGTLWILIITAIMLFTNLTLAETTLRTRGRHQLTGYAEKYLGKWGKRLMFISVVFGIYSALLAYLIGEGASLAQIIPGNTPPVIFAFFFWIILTLLLKRGIKGLKRIETWGVLAIITIILGIFISFLPQIQIANLQTYNPQNFTAPIGVVLFALLGFTSIPELRKEIKGQEHLMKKAIILGTLIPATLYILFTATFVGILGKEITQVATLSFGPIITILGIFTMFTAYFVLSFSLQSTYKYDLKFSKHKTTLLTSILPFTLYIIVTQLQLATFTTILGIGGVISGGATGIIILLMARKAKSTTRGKAEPEIQMPINWPIIIIISTLFIAGIILELSH